jgi:CRP-like cAMP-binding protein
VEGKDIERRFRSGEIIVERGSAVRDLFVVREGTVLLHETEGSPAQLLSPGDVFGETAALLGRDSAVRAQAEGDTVVLALDAALLNRLCSSSPEFAVRLLRLLAERADRAVATWDTTGSPRSPTAAAAPAQPAPSTPPISAPPLADTERALAGALLRCAQGDEPPLAVQGRLADLARESGLEMLAAYLCLQRLLDRQTLRLVDDQLSILKPADLRELAG